MDSLFRDNVCVYFGILLSLLIAYLLVVWVLQRSQSKQRMWNGIFVALESIPDILIILLSQLLVVIIFQKTGFMPVKLAGIGGGKGSPVANNMSHFAYNVIIY